MSAFQSILPSNPYDKNTASLLRRGLHKVSKRFAEMCRTASPTTAPAPKLDRPAYAQMTSSQRPSSQTSYPICEGDFIIGGPFAGDIPKYGESNSYSTPHAFEPAKICSEYILSGVRIDNYRPPGCIKTYVAYDFAKAMNAPEALAPKV